MAGIQLVLSRIGVVHLFFIIILTVSFRQYLITSRSTSNLGKYTVKTAEQSITAHYVDAYSALLHIRLLHMCRFVDIHPSAENDNSHLEGNDINSPIHLDGMVEKAIDWLARLSRRIPPDAINEIDKNRTCIETSVFTFGLEIWDASVLYDLRHARFGLPENHDVLPNSFPHVYLAANPNRPDLEILAQHRLIWIGIKHLSLVSDNINDGVAENNDEDDDDDDKDKDKDDKKKTESHSHDDVKLNTVLDSELQWEIVCFPTEDVWTQSAWIRRHVWANFNFSIEPDQTATRPYPPSPSPSASPSRSSASPATIDPHWFATLTAFRFIDHLAKSNHSAGLYLETDFVPVPHFQDRMADVMDDLKGIPRWDVVTIGTCCGLEYNDRLKRETTHLAYFESTRCFNAVMLSRDAAKKIMEYGALLDLDELLGVDFLFNILITTLKLKSYATLQPLVREQSKTVYNLHCPPETVRVERDLDKK